AGRGPIAMNVEAGKTYYWCACGRSANQPLCDGSHKGGEFSPRPYYATANMQVFFCCCKRSKQAPLCDGSHKSLT
ncbi:MAG TPA: CDGSH iron-sulfur domain-containing protein, partial [Steroidobacteraceae bacterium]|nr:CDGSH iron-sulfur domain-containing protein [Steroidobacteraceae bacterium]